MPLTNANSGLLDTVALVAGAPCDTNYFNEKITVLSLSADADPFWGGLPFGRGVTRSDTAQAGQAYDRPNVELAKAGGDFLGIIALSLETEGLLKDNVTDYTAPRGYKHDRPLTIFTKGRVAVPVAGSVKPGDSVYCVTSPGEKHGMFKADAADAVEVPGAVWRGAGGDGEIVALHIDGAM